MQDKKRALFEQLYYDNIIPALKEKLGYSTDMQVPRITKIVLNMGVGEATADKKIIEFAASDMAKIAGQKPVITKAKKSIAAFKTREGYPVGVKVTLRGKRMYDMLARLIIVALPRSRDFQGVSLKLDGRGNINFGIKEQIIFPEIEFDKVDAIRGLNVTIVTSANTDKEAKELLVAFNFPFRN